MKNKSVWEAFSILLEEITFSNSLIIHHVKTKKIASVKEVWIPGLNKHRFWRFYFSVYSWVFVSIEKIYQTLEAVFHRVSKRLEFSQKYSPARRILNFFLSVWISQWMTVPRVWYITWNCNWSNNELFVIAFDKKD